MPVCGSRRISTAGATGTRKAGPEARLAGARVNVNWKVLLRSWYPAKGLGPQLPPPRPLWARSRHSTTRSGAGNSVG